MSPKVFEMMKHDYADLQTVLAEITRMNERLIDLFEEWSDYDAVWEPLYDLSYNTEDAMSALETAIDQMAQYIGEDVPA